MTSEDCSETFEGAEVLRCGVERVDLHRLLRLLVERGVEKLLVEGGGTVAWSFLGSGLVDLLHVYIAPSVLGDSQAPSLFAGATASSVEDLVPMRLQEVTVLGGGVLLTFRPEVKGGSPSVQSGSGGDRDGV